MSHGKLFTMLAAAAFAVPVMVGCDEKVAEKKTESVAPNGDKAKVEEKTTKANDGTMTTKKETTVDPAGGGNKDTTESKTTVKPDGSTETKTDVKTDK